MAGPGLSEGTIRRAEAVGVLRHGCNFHASGGVAVTWETRAQSTSRFFDLRPFEAMWFIMLLAAAMIAVVLAALLAPSDSILSTPGDRILAVVATELCLGAGIIAHFAPFHWVSLVGLVLGQVTGFVLCILFHARAPETEIDRLRDHVAKS
jgi:CHASE2 domain-containing sensor protein